MAKEGFDENGNFAEGNLIALGNKGGGRKSAYEEYGRAKLLEQAFFHEFDVDEAEKIIAQVNLKVPPEEGKKRGKTTLFKVLLAKAGMKNEKMLIELMKKIFPDKVLDETPTNESPAGKLMDLLTKPKKNAKTKRVHSNTSGPGRKRKDVKKGV